MKSAAAVALAVATIEEHRGYDRVCVASFGIRRLYELRKRLGWRVPSAASALGVAANRFLPWVTWALNTPAPVLQILSVPVLGRRLIVLTPTGSRRIEPARRYISGPSMTPKLWKDSSMQVSTVFSLTVWTR